MKKTNRSKSCKKSSKGLRPRCTGGSPLRSLGWNRSAVFAKRKGLQVSSWTSISTSEVNLLNNWRRQQQSAEMQQTAKQSTTQNPEAMLFRMVRAQQDVVNVSDFLVPPGGAGTRSGLKSPVLESGQPTSHLGQRLAPPTPHVPFGGRTPPSAGLGNLSTESTGTGCERVR